MYKNKILSNMEMEISNIDKELIQKNYSFMNNLFKLQKNIKYKSSKLVKADFSFSHRYDYLCNFYHNDLQEINTNVILDFNNIFNKNEINVIFKENTPNNLQNTQEYIDLKEQINIAVNNINLDTLKDNLFDFSKLLEVRIQKFHQYDKYLSNYNYQQKRIEYEAYFNFLTKKQNEKKLYDYISRNEKASFVILDIHRNFFIIKELKLKYSENGIPLFGRKDINSGMELQYFLNDCIFLDNKFIKSLKEFDDLFNINKIKKIDIFQDSIRIHKDLFIKHFNKYIIKNNISKF